MTHSKQAAKRVRTNEQRRTRNRATRTEIRSAIKSVRGAATKTAATKDLALAMSLVDKAAKKRTLHPNAAARLKSRMAKAIAAKS
ncbi:MAG: 30S ribosomal protein S20 [Planctomycetota bacterium]|nr:MAG: 30S ribosomal protein S20 [Planctomycetota bacterium]